MVAGVSGSRADGDGFGVSDVKKLIDPLMNHGYFVFCDNFFPSVTLANELLKKDTYLCSTTRFNRKKFPDKLKKPNLKRGEKISEFVESDTVEYLIWQDQKSVHFINTIYNSAEQAELKRKNKDGSQTYVPCPVAVKNYNCLMGGVNVADAKRKVYSCSRHSKKWWHRLFYYIVDVCIVNAFIIQSESIFSEKMNQKSKGITSLSLFKKATQERSSIH